MSGGGGGGGGGEGQSVVVGLGWDSLPHPSLPLVYRRVWWWGWGGTVYLTPLYLWCTVGCGGGVGVGQSTSPLVTFGVP